MSIENAILELAAAIRYAADKTAGGTGTIAKLIENVTGGSTFATIRGSVANVKATSEDAALEKAVAKVETDAKAKQKEVMALVEADRKPSTAKEAINAALAEAKKAKEAAAAPALDWDKDVRPALLAVGKDRDALVKLMAKYEVPKGGKAPAEKWADLLAEANAILAARG